MRDDMLKEEIDGFFCSLVDVTTFRLHAAIRPNLALNAGKTFGCHLFASFEALPTVILAILSARF